MTVPATPKVQNLAWEMSQLQYPIVYTVYTPLYTRFPSQLNKGEKDESVPRNASCEAFHEEAEGRKKGREERRVKGGKKEKNEAKVREGKGKEWGRGRRILFQDK